MKAILFIVLLIDSFSVMAQSFTPENINDYNNKTYSLKTNSTDSFMLCLKPNNTYFAEYYSYHGLSWNNTGNYGLQNGKLHLIPKTCYKDSGDKDSNDFEYTLGGGHIELIYNNQSLYFNQFILVRSELNNNLFQSNTDELNNFILGVPGQELDINQVRYWGNQKIITMGMLKGITTSEVKIRESPDINGKVLEYVPHMEYYGEPINVPINTEVVVIARTEKKVQVQKWENYWYLVNVGEFNTEVWMFGEFVKFN